MVVVAHRYTTMPDEDFVAYLNGAHAKNVLHIRHSFSHAADRKSSYRWYRNGTEAGRGTTRDYRFLPEPFIYLKEFLATSSWVVRSRLKWDLYVGLDGLCTAFGLVMRRLGRVKKVSLWSIDFVPSGRFPSQWKDDVYRRINVFSALHADEVWDFSERMVEEKRRVLGLTPSDYRAHRVVPHGTWTERIQRFSYEEAERHTLVFMGHLLEKQGVQLVLEAIPRIVESIPDFRFKVIGDGEHASVLHAFAKQLGVQQYVDFLGLIADDQEMERQIARSGAAIAPYIRSLDTFTQFGADPGKIKIYLGCGVPILVTDVPWIAREIETRGCGLIISEELEDIVPKVTKLLKEPQVNQACRDNAARYALEFDYASIFARLEI